MRSQRQLRVGEEIRHSLAQVLQRGDVPWAGGYVPPMVTITEVQVSPDLQNATVFVMPLGGQQMKETLGALTDVVGFFRHSLARAVNLRYVPRLVFKADTSFSYSKNIERLLRDPAVAKDLATDDGVEG